jgi:hypothetical protein
MSEKIIAEVVIRLVEGEDEVKISMAIETGDRDVSPFELVGLLESAKLQIMSDQSEEDISIH